VNGAHTCVFSGAQAPEPSQFAGRIATPAAQLPVRQETVVSGYAQLFRSVPLHVPLQTVPSTTQAGRDPTGVPVTAEQMPCFPGTLQASHWPEQAVSQQTPSTQLLDLHCVAAKQASPLSSLDRHSPPPQKFPPVHSASVEQPVPQAVPSHTYGAHVVVDNAGHAPAPLQPAPAVATPPVQVAARQLVPPLGYVQTARLVPLQVPPHTEPSVAHAALPPTGAPVTAVQVPALPDTLQASH
jgi:hypothetical protein